jgi:hypothetical protein
MKNRLKIEETKLLLSPCMFCKKKDFLYIMPSKKFLFRTYYYIGCTACEEENDYAVPIIGGWTLEEARDDWNNYPNNRFKKIIIEKDKS